MKEKEGCWVVPVIKGIDGMYHSRTSYRVWLTESRCIVSSMISDGSSGPLPHYRYYKKKIIIKGEATGGPVSSTLEEGLGKRLSTVCAMNTDKLKRR